MKKKQYFVQYNQQTRVPVLADQTLLDAFLLAGLPLLHDCNGQARCSTCRILVLAGETSLSSRSELETRLDGQLRFPPEMRLACQTYCVNDFAEVSSIIRDATDISLYTEKNHEAAKQQIGVEQELVLFFLDIRNFTPFMETQLAFDVIHIIRKLFTLFEGVIAQHQGRVIEIAGDGMYAVFGLEQDLASSALSAVQAGYAILSDLGQLNEDYILKYFNRKLSIGIGIHQGQVVKGTISLGQENHMIIMGYPVNIASRLQNATKEVNNDFVVSSAVFSLLPDQPLIAKSMAVQLKGVSELLSIYLLGTPYTA